MHHGHLSSHTFASDGRVSCSAPCANTAGAEAMTAAVESAITASFIYSSFGHVVQVSKHRLLDSHSLHAEKDRPLVRAGRFFVWAKALVGAAMPPITRGLFRLAK
jgi:hypothetical protein